MRSLMSKLLLLTLLALLAGCGADSTESGGGDDTDGPSQVDEEVQSSGITLFRSGSALQTGQGENIEVTARVTGASGRLLDGVPVRFRIEGDEGADFSAAEGTTTSGNGFLTDSSGAASILVSSPTDRSNRTIQVVATVDGTDSEPLEIPIEGTTINILGPSAANTTDTIDVTARLVDSLGNPIPNEMLTFSSNSGSSFSPAEAETGPDGRVTTEFSVQASGSDSITVEGAGAQSTQVLTITGEQVEFTQPTGDRPEIELGNTTPITVEVTEEGNPQTSTQVDFTTSRGNLSDKLVTTDGSGVATTELSTGNSAGPAFVTAEAVDVETSKELLFVATNPESIDVQANPGTLSPGDESELKAVVRNSDNQPVKNQEVQFTITADDTGSSIPDSTAVTDEFGVATTTFVAGDASGGSGGVQIEASASGTINDATSITVGGDALFITLGTGNSIGQNDADTEYIKNYSVLVTDSSGAAVENQTVTLELVPNSFDKGAYVRGENRWNRQAKDTCPNEDQNRNGQLDENLNEDTNNDDELDPGNVAALSAQSVQTDNTGFATFSIRYPQDHATWVEVDLTGRAEVSGTESQSTVDFRLPVAAEDVNDLESEPPNKNSPFGTSAGCTNTN